MTDYCPYCFLYEKSGNLYASTAVQLPVNKNLGTPSQSTNGSTTTVTYNVNNSLGTPAGIRTPSDVQIAWDGSERLVKVEIVEGNSSTHTSLNSTDL
jgi:hypothetical protein